MTKTFVIGIDGSGVDSALSGLAEWLEWIKEKADELAHRLADSGQVKVNEGFAAAAYDGNKDYTVSTESTGEGNYVVKVNGHSVLFVEFGTGLIGYGHPELHGMGPGTYPPTDPAHPRWNQSYGWYYSDGGESHHTFGNGPNMPVYNAVKDLESEFEALAREVFSD